jgi:hypothetical protein
MSKNRSRIAAVLAGIIGAMAVLAGGRVLLGNDPGYFVINWLPVYNFILGILSAFIVAILIWKQSPYAVPAAIAIFGAHVLVMLILLAGYGDVVAKDSLVAMTIRITTWAIILALLLLERRSSRPVTV